MRGDRTTQEEAKRVLDEVLGRALSYIKTIHSYAPYRTVLNNIATRYHYGDAPGVPKGVVSVESVYRDLVRLGMRFPDDISPFIRSSLFLSLGLWRLAKGVYFFHPTLADSVARTPISRLPVELLFRLPEPAPLVVVPSGLPSLRNVLGFFVHLDWHGHSQDGRSSPSPPHLELRFSALTSDDQMVVFTLDLDSEDLQGAVSKTFDRYRQPWDRSVMGPAFLQSEDPRSLYKRVISEMLSLTLFLCQDEPDLGDIRPRPPVPVVRVGGERRVFPPDKPLIIPTGWRWGRVLSLARERVSVNESRFGSLGTSGRTVSPHVRRAHWHLYWVGKGSRSDPSKARPVLKWIPAILVRGDVVLRSGLSVDDLQAVVRSVREDSRSGDFLVQEDMRSAE